MKKLFLTNIMSLVALALNAQTDITKHFLDNYGFDSEFNYTSGQTNAVSQEIMEVKGWTADLSANYTIVGTYEFGFKGSFNGATVPSAGYDGETGGGLAISTGWEQTFVFSQEVTLPAGKYTVTAPSYNGCTTTAATSLLAWVPTSGTSVKSTTTSYAANAWTLDKISFTIDKTTKGKIQFGMKAAAGGSSNTAKLVIDYIRITGEDMAVDKTLLNEAIAKATACYADGNGNGAEELKKEITAAQAVADNANASILDVLEATTALNNAIDTYRKQNVSEENPLDATEYLVNPSFEDGTKGWTIDGLVSQTNSSFTKKNGSTYMEKWVGQGNKVGNASITQTVTDLPNGIYKLTVAAQNLNQSSTSQKCEGARIFADDEETTVYTPNDYSVTFTNLTNGATIGFEANGATGNWLATDNFRLSLIGVISAEVVLAETARLTAEAEALTQHMMCRTAADELAAAITKTKAITATYTDAEVADAVKAIKLAIGNARTSIAQYQALAKAADDAEAIYDAGMNGAEELKAEIDKARKLYANDTATKAQIEEEIRLLEKAVLAFRIANATPGTGTAPAVTATNKYVATGATQALVRATTTGSNILERGVCWSTERNPTVLDERTTKSFSLNGTIFHIKGMKPATVYYVRPYVMNKTYTVAYGDEIKVVTHPAGGCSWSWNEGAPDDAANTRCRNAIKETIDYFNEWTGIKGFHLTGNYGSGTPTADCSYGGWMRIGPNAAYQAIGTVLHETGHGVGVGTHWIWYNCSDTRQNTSSGKWLGRAATEVYQFLENKYTDDYYFQGDKTHGWGRNATYDWLVNGADKDKHSELQYAGGMCIMYGLFLDGLCPTSNHPNGIAGYTYNFDDYKKYYIMCKNSERGLGDGLLFQRNTIAAWKPYFNTTTEVNDSAAWYLEFNPLNGYYSFKNAVSGKYLTRSTTTSGMSVKQTSVPSTAEQFQLMPDRTNVTLGAGKNKVTTHGYWFTWYNDGNKAMSANALGKRSGYGTLEQTAFNFSNSATKQQWIIISEDELEEFRQAAIATSIKDVNTDTATNNSQTIIGIYNVDGSKKNDISRGLNIIKYNDGSTKKVYIK